MHCALGVDSQTLVITLRKETLEGIPARGEVHGARAVAAPRPRYLLCRREAHTGAAGLTLLLLSQVNLLSVTVPLTCAEMTDPEMARCPPDAPCMLIKLTIAYLPNAALWEGTELASSSTGL